MKFYTPVLSVVEKAAQSGLREAAEALLEESNARAPSLSGDLRAAGYVKIDDLTATIGYQSPKGYDYIARQHEDLDYKHPRGGEAKFLEKAETAMRGRLERIVGNAVRSELGG